LEDLKNKIKELETGYQWEVNHVVSGFPVKRMIDLICTNPNITYDIIKYIISMKGVNLTEPEPKKSYDTSNHPLYFLKEDIFSQLVTDEDFFGKPAVLYNCLKTTKFKEEYFDILLEKGYNFDEEFRKFSMLNHVARLSSKMTNSFKEKLYYNGLNYEDLSNAGNEYRRINNYYQSTESATMKSIVLDYSFGKSLSNLEYEYRNGSSFKDDTKSVAVLKILKGLMQAADFMAKTDDVSDIVKNEVLKTIKNMNISEKYMVYSEKAKDELAGSIDNIISSMKHLRSKQKEDVLNKIKDSFGDDEELDNFEEIDRGI
jgi:hypothetical protein